MNVIGRMKSLATLAVAGSLLAFAGGCDQQNVKLMEISSGRAVASKQAAEPAKVAEAPKAAPAKAAEPAPAPRAATSSNCSPIPAGYGISELAFPTGDRASSAIMLTQSQPMQVRAGTPFNYSICVTNLTNGTLQNVVVKNETLNNIKVQSSTPAGTAAGDAMMWALGTLNPRESKEIKLVGIANAVGSAGNCLSVAYANTLCANLQVVQPALTITKSITPTSILGCDPIVSSIEVKNTGSGDATNVVVTDTPDAGLAFASGGGSIPVGTLKAGESKKIDIAFKASKTGTYNNVASAQADGIPAVSSQKVTTKVTQPVLAIECKSPEKIITGRNAAFSFTVHNKGDAACDGTTVSVPLAGASFVSASDGGNAAGGTVTWNLGAMPAGASKTVTLNVAPSGLNGINLSATAQCKCAAAVSTSCKTDVIGIPAMLLDGFDDPDPIEVGGSVTYTLKVTNQSSTSALTNIRLVCTLSDPDKMSATSANGPTGAGNISGANITFPAIPTLAPKETREYKIVVKSTAAGQVQLKAEAVSNEITRPLVKTETTNFFQ